MARQKKAAGRNPAAISQLISQLADQDMEIRERARQSLVSLGKPAVPALLKALQDLREQVRWEAAQALRQIYDPAAVPALVSALEDPGIEVRWSAAEGLIAQGRVALAPLLRALMKRADSVWLREEAHHVLRVMAERDQDIADVLHPVVKALGMLEPEVEAPVEAKRALERLTDME
jgi:HEAT repeat protein